MQVVSGIATASGVSTLLNAPRDAVNDIRASVGEAARSENVRRKDAEQRFVERRATARPVEGPESLERAAPAPDRLDAGPSSAGDQRRERFVEAVSALRRDASQEPRQITSERLDEIRRIVSETPAALRAVTPQRSDAPPPRPKPREIDADHLSVTFADDGVPQPVEPPSPPPVDAIEAVPPIDLAEDGIPKQLDPIVAEDAPLPEPQTAQVAEDIAVSAPADEPSGATERARSLSDTPDEAAAAPAGPDQNAGADAPTGATERARSLSEAPEETTEPVPGETTAAAERGRELRAEPEPA